MTKYDKLKDLTNEILRIYVKKNTDYGNSFSKSFEEFGLVAPVVRMSDKMERIKTLTKSEDIKVTDESIRDTLVDLANYALMTVVEIDLENQIEEKESLFNGLGEAI